MKFDRIAVIVLDSVGIGELPDAAAFGDVGSHTLGHIVERVPGLRSFRNLRRWGLIESRRSMIGARQTKLQQPIMAKWRKYR